MARLFMLVTVALLAVGCQCPPQPQEEPEAAPRLSQAEASALALRAANERLPPDAGWRLSIRRVVRVPGAWRVFLYDAEHLVLGRHAVVEMWDSGDVEVLFGE